MAELPSSVWFLDKEKQATNRHATQWDNKNREKTKGGDIKSNITGNTGQQRKRRTLVCRQDDTADQQYAGQYAFETRKYLRKLIFLYISVVLRRY